jgi:hypothetical protein
VAWKTVPTTIGVATVCKSAKRITEAMTPSITMPTTTTDMTNTVLTIATGTTRSDRDCPRCPVHAWLRDGGQQSPFSPIDWLDLTISEKAFS